MNCCDVMLSEISKWDQCIAWLFPPVCPACIGKGTPNSDFCAACFCELPTLSQGCTLCAEALPQEVSCDAICGRCLAQPPAFDRVFAAFPYASPIDDLIRDLKFGKRLDRARLLATLIAARVSAQSHLQLPNCFIPIPLHPVRLRQRGFNQSLEITRTLARRFKVSLDAHSLKRIRARVPQTALPAKQRIQNPKGAFALSRAPRGQFIVLIDDVMTTGATVNEAAQVLKQAGVARVEAWVASRTQATNLASHATRFTATAASR